jgi:hypothetical protein
MMEVEAAQDLHLLEAAIQEAEGAVTVIAEGAVTVIAVTVGSVIAIQTVIAAAMVGATTATLQIILAETDKFMTAMILAGVEEALDRILTVTGGTVMTK